MSNLWLFSNRFVTFSFFGFAFTVHLVRAMHGKHGSAAHTQGAQSKLTSCGGLATHSGVCMSGLRAT